MKSTRSTLFSIFNLIPKFQTYTLLLLVSATLLACGGGGGGGGGGNNPSNHTVGGNVSGLSGSLELNLQSGGSQQSLTITSNGSFQFSTTLVDGSSYTATIASQPAGQNCTLTNASGTINSANVTSLTISCTTLNSTASLSGTITPAAGIDFDTDVNDPFAPYVENNDVNQAQNLNNNILSLHGFATAEPLSNFGVDGVFANTTDVDDFFMVNMQANQRITLQVVDFELYSPQQSFEGDLDLDLYLYNDGNSQFELVDFSNDISEFEEVVTPASGLYLIVVTAFSGASKYVMQLAPPVSGASTPAPVDFVAGEMLVKFKPAVFSKQNTPTISVQDKTGSTQKVDLQLSHQDYSRPVLAKIDLEPLAKIQASYKSQAASTNTNFNYDKMLTLKAIKQASLQNDIEYAEPNFLYKPLAVPNDNLYSYQWHYPLINLPQAWDITTGGTTGDPVVVAIIDTGIFLGHSDLQGKVLPGFDFISNPNISLDGDGIDANPDDPGDSLDRGRSSWHGTHVAGTVGASTHNTIGLAGVSWDAQLLPVRVLGNGGGTSADILEGFRYAAGLTNASGTILSDPADVINMSLGGPGFSQSMQNAVNEARNAGVIVIAAAGNDNTSQPFFPAAYDGVVSVSAVSFTKAKTSYSNFGDTIDVAAPGGEISQDLNGDGYGDGVLSTVADDTNGDRESTAAFFPGTSMAAPHVAGVAALMKAVYPNLSPAEFDTLLQSGAITEDLGTTGRDDTFGHGLIDAYLAVTEAQRLENGGTPPTLPPQLSAAPSSIVLYLTDSASVTLSNIGGDPDPNTITFNNLPAWLTITPTNVDANGLGDYEFIVDRTGLGDGTYQAVVAIDYIRDGSPDQISLNVSMYVGGISTDGELNTQFVILVRADTFESTNTVLAGNQNGTFTFTFNDVENGDYFIFSGTDVDNDNFLCQSGESCGGYPSLSEAEIISVSDTDFTNLNIVVDILGGLETGTLSTNNLTYNSSNNLSQGIKFTKPLVKPENSIKQLEVAP